MPRSSKPASLDGALVMDKPRGKTSHDVVEAVRRIVGFRQIGHLGTLDPLATGVLVLLLGKATRLAQFYGGRRKRYLSTFRFGYATDTYDSDGTATGPETSPILDRAEIEKMTAAMTGRFAQMPPPFSAKKIQGKAAYELARNKKTVELKAVEIEVYEFRVVEVDGSRAKVAIECAAGTYIRSLAHDMGQQYKCSSPNRLTGNNACGAHLEEITRTAVGEFTLDQAVKVEDLHTAARQSHEKLAGYVLPLERLLPELPRISVLPIVERSIRHGSKFNIVPSQIQPGSTSMSQGATGELDSGEWKPARLRVFSPENKLIAIAEAIVPRTYRPIVVFAD
jgi:tRNA pseudouridine55 synthase